MKSRVHNSFSFMSLFLVQCTSTISKARKKPWLGLGSRIKDSVTQDLNPSCALAPGCPNAIIRGVVKQEGIN